MALLYLENNLVAGAFTPDRVEMMKMLSSQIAISIDNANLYSNMEKMVADRTARLKKSLDDVRALKDQQDGDYFLTSLLLEPLNACRATVPGVNIDFIVKSKKKFTFKKWNRELGGDICIAYDLILKGEKYPVFLNADAMGKSIQGAGGAIVLGAVFKAMVERTNSAPSLGDQSPKEWIIGALKELQAVFESFDCSMMISLVLGLVDVRTGRMYFINAEHPFTVLYRNGRALFLEKELTIRKLGIPELILPDKVYAVQLKPGDIIIAGSDGRDDILLESGRDGGLVMNEDENLFLRSVEKAGGSLAQIEEEIFASGAQTDDLSLLRIEFTGVDI
jgi:serine phosphatase RsbU (regulator of sigma subunit)